MYNNLKSECISSLYNLEFDELEDYIDHEDYSEYTYIDGEECDYGVVKYIESVFRKEGYSVYNPIDDCRLDTGYLGTSSLDGVVYNLTHYKHKTILTFEEFMKEESPMKKLNIKKDYRDKTISVTTYNGLTVISLRNNRNNGGNVSINLSKNSSTTLAQANAILSVMGLSYELVDSTDWSKVEVGADVKITTTSYEATIVGNLTTSRKVENKSKAQFHSYVPSLKKVIVICGTEIKAVDEDEVEL